jgi:uncharacterized protein (DUF302 family)
VSETLQAVDYAGVAAAPVFQHVSVSRFSFDETIARLKRALDAEDLWLIHEIDPQMLLRKGGYRIFAVRQLLFFHPRYMARLLAVDVNALIEVPLKLVVMEMPDATVTVRHPRAPVLFARYVGFEQLAEEFASVYRRLIEPIER